MDKIKETIVMLEGMKYAAEPIQTPDCGCGYSTLIPNIKCDDSFIWLMEETISLLEELQNIKTQQMVMIKNVDKSEIDKLKYMLSSDRGLIVAPDVEIVPLNTINKSTCLSSENIDMVLQKEVAGIYEIAFEDNGSCPSRWAMKLTSTEARKLTQDMINIFGGGTT